MEVQQRRHPFACLGNIPNCHLSPSPHQVVPTFSALHCSLAAAAEMDRELFAVGSLADNEGESQASLTVALESFGTIPSWLEASAFDRSSCCKPGSLASSYCSRYNRKDRTDKLDTVGNYLDVGVSVDAVDNFRTNVDCIRALLV